jgi:hypothetical protein
MNAKDLNSMPFDQLVPSKSRYLAKDDVGPSGLILTVRGFKIETIETDDGDEEKTVLHFVEAIKPMVLNRTNAQLLAAATGAKTAGDARGRSIVVFADPNVSFGGKITGGLRIRAHVEERPKAAPARPAPAATPPALDDKIPF